MQHKAIFLAAVVAVCAIATAAGPSAVHAADKPQPSNQTQATTTQAEPAKTDTKPEDTSPVKQDYTVQSGDYLEAIAQNHNISWPSIYQVNDSIQNPDMIYPDQKLSIPNQDVVLTRTIPQESNLAIPADYNPAPATATQTTSPSTVKANSSTQASTPAPTAQPQAVQKTYAAPTASAVVGGVPGLSLVLHSPYVYGGTSPAGFDCSGLTMFLAAQKGVSIPRTASGQYSALRHISLAEALPGDIVVFNMNHVGTYLGGGQVVHALNPSQGIQINDLQMAIRYNGFVTMLAVGH